MELQTIYNTMKTYRQELESMKPIENNGNTNVSLFITTLYKFIKWLIKLTQRQSGYLTFMSQNKDPTNVIDILTVLIDCIDDNECYLTIDKKHKELILILKNLSQLVLEHLDDNIRNDPHLIYDEETDDENPLLQQDMLSSIFSTIILIINYESVNKEKND